MRDDHRMYRTFEEFEREELRRMDAASLSGGIDSVFEEELEIELFSARGARSYDVDDDE